MCSFIIGVVCGKYLYIDRINVWVRNIEIITTKEIDSILSKGNLPGKINFIITLVSAREWIVAE